MKRNYESTKPLRKHLIGRIADAYDTGDKDTFDNATVAYDEMPVPTMTERLEAGEITHITNSPTGVEIRETDGQSMSRVLYDKKNAQRAYGEDEVYVGNAFDPETGKASGIPRMVGVYVTKRAFEAAKTAEKKAS